MTAAESSVTVIVVELDPDRLGTLSPGVARPFYAAVKEVMGS